MIKECIVANGHGPLSPMLFAIHSTANPGATAQNHVRYWIDNPDYAVHLVSDWNECFNTVPYDRLCYQVGNGNSTCEGIEICEATNRSDFERGIEIAAEAVAERLEARGWGVDRLRSHKWFTENYGGSDHVDPIPYFDKWDYSWSEFVDLVDEKLNGTSAVDEEETDMVCIFRPNGEDYLVYYDGTTCHQLHHPDEAEAIKKVYNKCYGKDIPMFELGDKKAPWATRFMDATKHSAPKYTPFIVK